jgi:MFS family permease
VLLLGLGEALYAPTADALPAALAPLDLRGRYAALHQMAWGISDTIAPTLAAAAVAAGNSALWLTLQRSPCAPPWPTAPSSAPMGGRDGIAGSDLGGVDALAPEM